MVMILTVVGLHAQQTQPLFQISPVILKESLNTQTKKMTTFNPEKHGFKFSNTFSNKGFVAGVHIDFSGLCGGMSYAMLDYYYKGVTIPSQTQKPNEGTQLTKYIRSRQWYTYDAQADKWVELGFNPFGERTSEFWNWGVQGFNGGRLEELKSRIDQGKPVPLGLFAAGDGGLTSKHHQVIAIGYDMGRYRGDLKEYKDDLKIYICDPNYPGETKVLRPNSAKHRYYYEDSPSQEWLTYFVDMKYRAVAPLDPAVVNRCTNTNFVNKNMSGQTLNEKNYRCAKASGVDFRGATISGTDFEQADLTKGYFLGANCRNTNFAYALLLNANFEGADLKNCNLSYADAKSARFYGSDLRYAIMNKANAEGANFQGADLHQGKFEYVSFKRARLYGTSLNTANCYRADFSGANLDGADLRGANLGNANFAGAIITSTTKFDASVISQVKNWPGVR
jgi:uncharacterized protein YjbI with pentapeptide repeats